MALSETTIETFNYIQDAQLETNIKITFFFFILILSIFLIWKSKNIPEESTRQEFLQKLYFGLGVAGLFSTPSLIFLLQREVTLDFITNIIFSIYTIVVTGIGIFILWLGTEWVLTNWFGVNFKSSNKKTRNAAEYRRSQ